MLALWFVASFSAQAAPLVQCSGTVAVGEASLVVTGLGADEATARADARRMARHAGVRLFAEPVWTQLLTEDRAGLRKTLDAAAIDPSFGVPGATWTEAACTTLAAPDGAGFTATVAGHSASRADAALAVSAARRAECEQAWAMPVARSFMAVAIAPPERRPEILAEGYGQARAGLTACHAAAPAIVAGPAPADAAPGGVVECQALATDGRIGPQGVGFGASVDAAVADAAWERGTNQILEGLAASHEAVAHASPETQMQLIANGLRGALATLPADLASRSLTTCRVVPDAPVRWVPLDLDEALECAEKEEWPRLKASVPGEAGRTALCSGHAGEGLAMANDAVAHASPETQAVLQSAGWSLVLGCDAACRTRSRIEAEGKAIAVPGLPSRATKEETQALLRRALAERDIGLLVAGAPALADPRALLLYAGGPKRFWEMLDEQLPPIIAGELPAGMAWGKVGDAVVLVPAR